MSVSKRAFGNIASGQEASLYTIKDKSGMSVKVTDYGATVVSVIVPDRNGIEKDVLLGFDSVEEYERDGNYLGAFIGRCADRIKDGEVLINGKRYMLDKNDGNNNRHSGPHTYNKRMWRMTEAENNSVTFELISPEGDQGFPGELILNVRYSIADGNRLVIESTGEADADTIMNFSNRCCFNLDGHGTGTVEDQFVWISADTYAKLDSERIPTGEIANVKGTVYDFTSRKRLAMDDYTAEIRGSEGYSISYSLNCEPSEMTANMYSSKTGILMNVYTDLPCLKLYVPDSINVDGKDGRRYGRLPGACLATQYLPDAIHHPGFASPIVRSGDKFYTRTIYEFQTVEAV